MSRLALPLFLLAACAAPQETRGTTQPSTTQPAAAASSEDEQVCHEEMPTGSHVARTVCRSRSQIDREREQGQELQRKGNLAPEPRARD